MTAITSSGNRPICSVSRIHTQLQTVKWQTVLPFGGRVAVWQTVLLFGVAQAQQGGWLSRCMLVELPGRLLSCRAGPTCAAFCACRAASQHLHAAR